MNRFILWLDKRKKIIMGLAAVIILILTVVGYQAGIFTDQVKMEAFLNGCGIFAPIAFVILQAIQVVVPIMPGAIGCLYGVIFFGAIKGFLLNYVGICIGSVLAFLIARNYGRDFVQKVTGGKFFQKYSKYLLKENQFEKLFALLIFLPVAPDDFLCYLAGISKMKLKKFTAIILLGKPAAIMLYSLGLTQIFQVVLKLIGQ